MSTDAVVVGAGAGGLVAARTLAARGLSVVVLEAADRPGGPVRGGTLTTLPSVPLDLGAESFAARGTAVQALAEELGLVVEAPAPAPAWGYAAGRAFPLPAAGILGIPSRPWARDVRRAVGWPGVLRGSLDRLLPRSVADTSDLGAFARSRLGRRVTDRLVAPVAAGVHSAPLTALDVGAVAPGLLEAFARTGSLSRAVASLRAAAPAGSAVRGLDGGMHGLVDALAADLDVRLGTPVTRLDRGPDGAWRVTTPAGTLTTRRLVAATSGVPGLAEAVGAAVPRPERGADIRLVTLLLDAPELDAAPRGSGMLVAPDEGGVRAKALTHSTAKWPWLARRVAAAAGPGVHVVRLSYGRIGSDTAEPSVHEAARDASALLGVDVTGRVRDALTQRWDGSLPPPTPAYRAQVRALQDAVLATDGLAVTGGWVAGTGLAAIVPHAQAAAERLATPASS